MAKNSKPLALPDDVFSQLADADRQRGFPPGTMQSLMQQEAGGQLDKFLADPGAYHYGLNAEGRRIAGHTGKVSTAHGPFGILESTAKDPGYGVKPMGDRSSLTEHIRFAADYLAGRSKSAGGLQAGLAGYGEGEKYAAQVARRRDGGGRAVIPASSQTPQIAVAAAPTQAEIAQAVAPAPVVLAQAAAPAQAQIPEDMVAMAQPQAAPPIREDPWQAFLAQMRTTGAAPTQMGMDYGRGPDQTAVARAPAMPAFAAPDFMAALAGLGPQAQRPNFGAFGTFSGKGRA